MLNSDTSSDSAGRRRAFPGVSAMLGMAALVWISALILGLVALTTPVAAVAVLVSGGCWRLGGNGWRAQAHASAAPPRWVRRVLLASTALTLLHAAVDPAGLNGFPFHYRILRADQHLVWIGLAVACLGHASASSSDRVEHVMAGALVFALLFACLLPFAWQGWPTLGKLYAIGAAVLTAASSAALCLMLFRVSAQSLRRRSAMAGRRSRDGMKAHAIARQKAQTACVPEEACVDR